MEENKVQSTNQIEGEIVKRKPGRPPKIQVEEKPEEVIKKPDEKPVEEKITDPCWNCGEQLQFGKCEACGFDLSLIHNADLDSKRESQRRKETQ